QPAPRPGRPPTGEAEWLAARGVQDAPPQLPAEARPGREQKSLSFQHPVMLSAPDGQAHGWLKPVAIRAGSIDRARIWTYVFSAGTDRHASQLTGPPFSGVTLVTADSTGGASLLPLRRAGVEVPFNRLPLFQGINL